MAQVYDAWALGESGFERRVALKRVLPEYLDDTAIRRMFLDEARIASQLHHGNIVPVIDYGTIDGTEFLAMEFVDGVDARKAVKAAAARGETMPLEVGLNIIAAIAHALDYAHGLKDKNGQAVGIVHRDVTPQNVLLSWNGDVLLSDFGIALATNRDERTKTGLIKGKLGFIAPEQLQGKHATTAVDIFGLGATLHALLTGDSPVEQAAAASGLSMHLEIAPELPPEVQRLVAECMSLEPQARPTARQMAARCIELLALRTHGDGRSLIRDWLAGLRADFTQRNGLDDLMQMVLVPMNPADPKTLTVMRMQSGATTSLTSAQNPSSLRRVSRRRFWLVGGGGAMLVAAGTTAVLWEPRGDQKPAPAPPAPPAPAPAPPHRPMAAEPKPLVSPPLPPSSPPPASRAHAGAKRRAKKSDPSALGWLRVGGAALAGAAVSVDGRRVGFAPLEQVLPEGLHDLRVTDAKTGRLLHAQAITVATEHTRTSPLRVIR